MVYKLPVEPPGKLLFWGIAGSKGFGLSEPGSDTDYKGVYVAPTKDFFKFTKPAECVTHKDPDTEIDEIEKFLKLVCKGNHHHLEFLYFEPQYIGHAKLYEELKRVVPHIVPRDDYFNCVRGLSSKVRYDIEAHHMDHTTSKPLDYKQIMHGIRILDVGAKFLSTRIVELKVSQSQRDMLLSIKHGNVKPTQLLRIIDTKLRKLSDAYDVSVLRKKITPAKAEQYLDKIRRNHEFYS